MYDPVRRTYKHKGITYHSVSTIITPHNTPALSAWASRVVANSKDSTSTR